MTAPLGGLRAVTPKRRREIAALGGRAAHKAGVAHCFTSEEARAAGRRGGAVVAARPGHMAALSKLGDDSRRRAAAGKPPRREHARNPVRLVIVPRHGGYQLELRRGIDTIDVLGKRGDFGPWDLIRAGCKAGSLAKVVHLVAARQGFTTNWKDIL